MALGAGLAVLGVLMVSVTGVDVAGSTMVRFIVVDITPVVALATLAAGSCQGDGADSRSDGWGRSTAGPAWAGSA